MHAEPAYDFFVSFAEADRSWVQGFLIPALGLPPERAATSRSTGHSETFTPGAVLVDEFERAVSCSRYTVLIVSSAFLSDEWSSYGEQLASYVAVQEQQARVIPLVLQKDCHLPLRIQFRVQLDCTDRANWESEVARLRQLLDLREPQREQVTCPYPGMVPFTDARFFYGRSAEVRDMLQHFRNQSLLFVIGPSGCGKSSLIFAGLLPALQSGDYFAKDSWLIRDMRPGQRPIQELGGILGGDPAQPANCVARLLGTNLPAGRVFLVIDQFEELFSQAERAEQTRFIAALLALREVEQCAMLISVRADFYPDLLNCELWKYVKSQRLELAPLRGDALREAIKKPAAEVGVWLEPGLVERLMADAADEPGALPLLQETMRLLWPEMKRRFLPLRAYEQLGGAGSSGLAVAIARKADATLQQLPDAEQAVARRMLLRLVQFGEGRAHTRRQQTVAELRSTGDDPTLFERTLNHLVKNRLLTLSGDESDPEQRKADLAHEILIGTWKTLQSWIKERSGAEQMRRRLQDKALEWIRMERKGGLLDAAELEEARRWLQIQDAAGLGNPSPELAALIQASAEVLEKAEREREEVEREKEAGRQRRLSQAQSLSSREGLTVAAYRGDGTVMLTFSLDERLTENLAGFAIQCSPPEGKPYYLSGLLNFDEGIDTTTIPAELRRTPSDQAPLQSFRWIHRPENLVVGPYEYTVCAMYFENGRTLKRGPSVAVQVELGLFASGRLEVGFTRGWSSPESFLRQFGDAGQRPPSTGILDWDSTAYAAQYEWLGFHARKMLFDFLDACIRDESATLDVFAFDLNEPDIIKGLLKLGPRVRAFLDDASIHTKPGSAEREALRLLLQSAGANNIRTGHFKRFAHSKMLIQKRGGMPVRVLTGSANFAVRALSVQANNVLIFDDPATAQLYEQAFEQAFHDPSRNQAHFACSPIAGGWFDVKQLGLPVFSVAFSPHKFGEVALAKVAQHIDQAESSVFFVVLGLEPGGPVLHALQKLPSRRDVFWHGIAEHVQAQRGQRGKRVIPFAGLRSTPPALFAGSPGMGMLVQLKFIVVDFNDAQPVVITGSSNLALGGEVMNGDNLIAIYDRGVATAYAIEAIRMVDHYQFVVALRNATRQNPLLLQRKGAGQPWWQPYYEPGNFKRRERLLFTR
jgi:energy-coupling factor transporter ATP-binding protein EcfA2